MKTNGLLAALVIVLSALVLVPALVGAQSLGMPIMQYWPPAEAGGGTWGSIAGTLGDQTDLQSALDEKVTFTSGLAGSGVPATCVTGSIHVYTDTADLNFFVCNTTNTWRIVPHLAASPAWTGSHDFGGAQLEIPNGSSAPSSGNCDASAEVGRLYVQTGDPASVNLQLFRCTQTGAASYAWHPVSHQVGTTAPATCSVGAVFFDSDATAGSNWFGCTSANTWTLMGGTASLPVVDTTSIAEGSSDNTKEVRFEVDGLPPATTAVLTVPASLTLQGTPVAGTGVTISCTNGTCTYSADGAVINHFTTGTGSPPGTCTAGKDVYVKTDQLRACICSATDTWTCNGKLRAHATDCTSLTDGLADEMCFERDANTLYVCEPSAGGCDTAGEWTAITGGSGAPTDAKYIVAEANGSLSAEVAPSAADQVPVSDSTTAATWQTLPNGAVSFNTTTNAFAQATLANVASSTSADLRGVLSDEYGAGIALFLDGSGNLDLAGTRTLFGSLAVISVQTTTHTTTAAQSGYIYTNTGDTNSSTITLLNDPTIGVCHSFAVTAAFQQIVGPSTGETLYLNGSACGTTMSSSTVGSAVSVCAVTSGSGALWFASGSGYVCD